MLILLETMAEERRTATAPELLEPLMARLAGASSGGAGRKAAPTARGRRCTAWPYPT